MKATGIVRKLDDLGRLVIPKELRDNYSITCGDAVEFFVEDNHIVLRKYNPGCALCGRPGDLIKLDTVQICRECIDEIARLAR